MQSIRLVTSIQDGAHSLLVSAVCALAIDLNSTRIRLTNDICRHPPCWWPCWNLFGRFWATWARYGGRLVNGAQAIGAFGVAIYSFGVAWILGNHHPEDHQFHIPQQRMRLPGQHGCAVGGCAGRNQQATKQCKECRSLGSTHYLIGEVLTRGQCTAIVYETQMHKLLSSLDLRRFMAVLAVVAGR